jgi:hypothetical protein
VGKRLEREGLEEARKGWSKQGWCGGGGVGVRRLGGIVEVVERGVLKDGGTEGWMGWGEVGAGGS